MSRMSEASASSYVNSVPSWKLTNIASMRWNVVPRIRSSIGGSSSVAVIPRAYPLLLPGKGEPFELPPHPAIPLGVLTSHHPPCSRLHRADSPRKQRPCSSQTRRPHSRHYHYCIHRPYAQRRIRQPRSSE